MWQQNAICWNYVGLSWKKNFAKPYKILTHSAYSDNFYFQFFYWLSEWVEILWGFMKFVFTQLLIIAAFYLSVCVRHLFTVIVYAIRPLKIELIYGLCSKCYIGGARIFIWIKNELVLKVLPYLLFCATTWHHFLLLQINSGHSKRQLNKLWLERTLSPKP